ncbi:MAG TPA: hypothetical protein VM509_13820, partial [Planctomycetota bacterium]|nr:hypothetical protein [Planctomycetota bacterium]
RTGLSQFYGASMAVGRTERGLAEALTLHSPAGIDLITHVLTGQPLDTTLARCVPAGLANAGLYSFDGTRVIADLCLMLPPEAQSGLVRALSEFRRQLGVDFEKDVLCNFGPTLALATSGFSLTSEELPRTLLALQVVDAARAQRSLGALLVASGRSDEVKHRTIDGVRVSSLQLPLGEVAAEIDLHWCVSASVLLLSTDLDELSTALRGLRAREVVHVGLRDALAKAGSGCFAVGFTQGDDGTPDAVSIGRRTNAGLELTAADGAAMQSTVFLLGSLGALSSFAIPHLLEARHDANEKAAASRLVVINDAQIMARMEAFLDQDHDGRGESLFLAELCGEVPLRGSKKPLAEPWLANDFRWIDDQIGEKNGYLYRVRLRGEDDAGELSKDSQSVDAAEQSCIAYAWPIDEKHGSAVYVFDSECGLCSSDNRGERQHYFGDDAPPLGAHWAQGPGEGRPGAETRTVGRDGGVWLRLRSVEDREAPVVRSISR